MLYQVVFKEKGDFVWRYSAWREKDELVYFFENKNILEYFIQNEDNFIVYSV